MANSLTPVAVAPLPERFANPLQQISGALAQPAVRRSLPLMLLIGLVGAAALAWSMLSTPTQKTLFSGLPDSDKAAVTGALTQAGIKSRIDDGTGALTVGEEDYSRAKMLLAGQGLPKAAPGGYQILDQLPMGVSRAVEGERLRQARETELAKSIEQIDAVAEARVHLGMPEASVFLRDNAQPSASVMVKLQGGRSLSDAQVQSIVNLVASSVPGMKPESVTIVDQLGALLSKPGAAGAGSGGNERLDAQRRVEDKMRTQLVQLLTPLVGAGNFTAEVQADVDLDETQATSEKVNPGVLRAETGNWTGNQKEGPAAPGGIPGALSNTPPPASTLAPGGSPAPSPAPSPAAGHPAPDANKQSDQFQRAYDLGKEVSVTRNAPGGVKRLSVAVLLRDPDKGPKRSQMEINQVTDLVKGAVGYNQQRQDNVTVISRKFAADAVGETTAPRWYDNAWLPIIARNVTAIVIALLVLILGVRPLAKALMKRRDETPRPASTQPALAYAGSAAQAGAVALDQIAQSQGYDQRIDAVRGFTRDNPARAALAVRDMIAADKK